MNDSDKLLIKNLKTKLKNNNPCAFITIETNELKKLLKIIENGGKK